MNHKRENNSNADTRSNSDTHRRRERVGDDASKSTLKASKPTPKTSKSSRARVSTKLLDYIKIKDPELYEVMERLCMQFALQAGRNMSGVTFLQPVDNNTRERIFDLANSENIDEMYEATHLLNAMIIKTNIASHREFHNNKDNIINRLDQKLEVANVHPNRIEFANGAHAIINPDFAKLSQGESIYSLYSLTGELPINGNKSTARKQRSRGRRAHAHDDSDNEHLNSRAIAETLEERHRILAETAGEYYEALVDKVKSVRRNGKITTTTDFSMRDPYVKKSLSLLMFAKKKYPDLYNQLLARTSLEKSDLYLYLQSNGDQFLISPEILREWNRGETDLGGITVEEAIGYILDDINNVLYSNESQRINALECIDDERDELRNNLIDYRKLARKYSEMMKYLPEKITSEYTVEQKIYEDDFRMASWALFVGVENAAFDEGLNPLIALEDTVAKLNQCSRGPYESRTCIVGGGAHVTKDIPAFIDSIWFMYVPTFDILEDLDLIPVDEISDHLEDDSIFAGNTNGVEDIIKTMGSDILGVNLSTKQVLNAIDILLAKKRAGTLTKEEEWRLNEISS